MWPATFYAAIAMTKALEIGWGLGFGVYLVLSYHALSDVADSC